MVQCSLATTMAFSKGISVWTQILRIATWVVKETRVRPVAGRPYLTYTISLGRTPLEPVVPSVTLGMWTSQGCYRYVTPSSFQSSIMMHERQLFPQRLGGFSDA